MKTGTPKLAKTMKEIMKPIGKPAPGGKRPWTKIKHIGKAVTKKGLHA